MFDRIVAALERSFGAIANLSVALTMIILAIDAVSRYLFNKPMPWAYDFVSRYLMVAIFYGGLSLTLRENAHIRVLFFRKYLGRYLKPLLDATVYLASCALFASISYLTLKASIREFMNNEMFVGAYLWPVWITTIMIAVGSLCFTLRLAVMFLRRARDITTGAKDPDVDSDQLYSAG